MEGWFCVASFGGLTARSAAAAALLHALRLFLLLEFCSSSFRAWGLGFGVWGLGFGVWGLGFGVWGLGFGVWGLGFGV